MEWLKSTRASLYLRYQCLLKLDPLFQWNWITSVSDFHTYNKYLTAHNSHRCSWLRPGYTRCTKANDISWRKVILVLNQKAFLYANILAWVNTICMKMMATLQSMKLILLNIQLNCSPWKSLISMWDCDNVNYNTIGNSYLWHFEVPCGAVQRRLWVVSHLGMCQYWNTNVYIRTIHLRSS